MYFYIKSEISLYNVSSPEKNQYFFSYTLVHISKMWCYHNYYLQITDDYTYLGCSTYNILVRVLFGLLHVLLLYSVSFQEFQT